MTTDLQRALRLSNPVRDVPGYTAARSTALLDRAVGQGRRGQPRAGGRTALAGAVAAALVATGGGIAWAVWGQPPDSVLQVACSAGMDRAEFERLGEPTSVLGNSTGDPIGECAAEYERQQDVAPALTAYETGESYVAVVPADWAVPQQWRPLPASFRSDPRRVELQQRLDDAVDGPASTCRTADDAEAVVRADLRDLGLDGWSIERRPAAARAGSNGWCAVAWVDDERPAGVVLQGVQGGSFAGDDALGRVVQDLRAGISDRCLPLAEAERVARAALQRNGFDPAQAQVTASADPDARCSRVDLVPAGRIVMLVRGPSA